MLDQLLLYGNHQAANGVAVHRIFEELLAEVDHDHHVTQVVMVWESWHAFDPRILVEYSSMVLVYVEALANVASLLVMEGLLFDFVPVFDTGRMRNVGLLFVVIREIVLIFFWMYLSYLSDIIVRYARYLLSGFFVMRVTKLFAHGQYLLGCNIVHRNMVVILRGISHKFSDVIR